ncbi:MAG: DUF2141 domain-containing protein, partial [Saprospiraceae bacterium]|nr:DUF2141 domain-containing protein [Saprospiraceae bacterium]
MKQLVSTFVATCAILTSLFSQQKGTLEIEATSFRNTKGHMRFAVYNNKSYFLDTKGYFTIGVAPIVGNKSYARIDLPSGTYAVSYMHDENDDNKMEYTLGIPREGFGIS